MGVALINTTRRTRNINNSGADSYDEDEIALFKSAEIRAY